MSSPPKTAARRARDDAEDDEVIVIAEKKLSSPPKNSAAAVVVASTETKKKVFPLFASKATAAAAAVPSASASSSTSASSALNLKQYVTDPEWKSTLASTFDAPYFKKIEEHLAAEEKAKAEVFPPRPDIFTALNVCPLSKVKVVLIGQDPYHDNRQAHGLCFSVLPGIKTPPSLANMYKELKTDIPGFEVPSHGYLMDWAKQGILMLNATLTVQAHKANSHEKIGWQIFTDKIIDLVNERVGKPVVFLLWGGFAQKKGKRVNRQKHRVIENAHPSPLSATKWFGCKCFSKCNDALKELGEEPINWMLPVKAPAAV